MKNRKKLTIQEPCIGHELPLISRSQTQSKQFAFRCVSIVSLLFKILFFIWCWTEGLRMPYTIHSSNSSRKFCTHLIGEQRRGRVNHFDVMSWRPEINFWFRAFESEHESHDRMCKRIVTVAMPCERRWEKFPRHTHRLNKFEFFDDSRRLNFERKNFGHKWRSRITMKTIKLNLLQNAQQNLCSIAVAGWQ